jgi:hypothetical protein
LQEDEGLQLFVGHLLLFHWLWCLLLLLLMWQLAVLLLLVLMQLIQQQQHQVLWQPD